MERAASIDLKNWIARPQTQTVMDALERGGKSARFVGGCVRDALLGLNVKDVDIATPETPERVIELIEEADLRAIPTGIDHGTVTAICDGIPFEITTLRRDIETYGRRARVSFTEDWAEDAARRDLTLNALYCDRLGKVYDPIGGLEDLKAGRIRFVGDARARIEEDILRLLRFFRFFAFYGSAPADVEALNACRDMAPQLNQLSVERVWKELSRLLLAPDPTQAFSLMSSYGILAHILPEANRSKDLHHLVQIESDLKVQPSYLRRLASIVDLDANGANALASRFKFSNAERDEFSELCNPPDWPDPQADRKRNRLALYRLKPELFIELVLLGATRSPALDWPGLLSFPEDNALPAFSITGQDVIDGGVPTGSDVGNILTQVENWWIESDFTADRDSCLAYLSELITARS